MYRHLLREGGDLGLDLVVQLVATQDANGKDDTEKEGRKEGIKAGMGYPCHPGVGDPQLKYSRGATLLVRG